MSLKQEFELLRRVPIFAEIEPAKLKLLAFMSERVGFDPGKRLMQQGDPADAAYLIIDGHAEVILETPAGPVIVATLGANDFVGEMAILGDVPRNATVREFPTMAVSIMQELAHRLDLTNHQLSTALAEVKQLREGAGIAACPVVSRLDSFIRRLKAQRACLDLAAGLVRGLDGEILELGLGNGRTYDHLR